MNKREKMPAHLEQQIRDGMSPGAKYGEYSDIRRGEPTCTSESYTCDGWCNSCPDLQLCVSAEPE